MPQKEEVSDGGKDSTTIVACATIESPAWRARAFAVGYVSSRPVVEPIVPAMLKIGHAPRRGQKLHFAQQAVPQAFGCFRVAADMNNFVEDAAILIDGSSHAALLALQTTGVVWPEFRRRRRIASHEIMTPCSSSIFPTRRKPRGDEK